MTSATRAVLPVPHGMSGTLSLLDAMTFQSAVDQEIARLKGHGEPDALWIDELLPLYAAGVPPAEAAGRVLAARYPRPARRKCAHRRRGVFKLLLDGWREWDFRRALRQTGRA